MLSLVEHDVPLAVTVAMYQSPAAGPLGAEGFTWLPGDTKVVSPELGKAKRLRLRRPCDIKVSTTGSSNRFESIYYLIPNHH